MKVLYKTDVGNKRQQNEDSIAVQTNKLGMKLLLVADGMGGHNAGDVASQIAKKIIVEEFKKIQVQDNILDFITQSIAKANLEIYTLSIMETKYSNMGTTLSILIDDGQFVYIGHVGDSRIYYLDNKKNLQITKDHTFVQSLVDEGSLKSSEMRTHPYRNMLMQSLGGNKKIRIDKIKLRIPNKGYILLCSDGLTEELTDDEIYEIIKKEISLEKKMELLLSGALEKEGKDNISFIIMER